MKVVTLFFVILTFHVTFCAREIIFDSFEYSPKESDLIDYGSLQLKQGKTKSSYNLSGNFTIKRTLGNEKLMTFEVYTRTGVLLIRNTYAFCEFIRIEKMIWPDLVKHSDLPKDSPCPFPANEYSISKFVLNESKFPRQVRSGQYTVRIQMMEFGKNILAFVLKISLKQSKN